MPQPLIPRSQRFTKAALAERNRLVRRRSQLTDKREELETKLGGVGDELAAVDEEIHRLEELAGVDSSISKLRPSDETQERVLKGAAIRTLAVPLLLRERGEGPIHYREWLGLLTSQGYEVAGKRPEAVFLNQVVRSPLVRATTRSGYYELDLSAVDHLRETLLRQQAELASFTSEAPTELGQAFDDYRERQREMNLAISRTERGLKEATSAIEAARAAERAEARAA